jgi:hypothetical protein
MKPTKLRSRLCFIDAFFFSLGHLRVILSGKRSGVPALPETAEDYQKVRCRNILLTETRNDVASYSRDLSISPARGGKQRWPPTKKGRIGSGQPKHVVPGTSTPISAAAICEDRIKWKRCPTANERGAPNEAQAILRCPPTAATSTASPTVENKNRTIYAGNFFQESRRTLF